MIFAPFFNFWRQIIHDESGATSQRKKVDSAADRLRSLNAAVAIEKYDCKLNYDNATEYFSKYDVVVDATDNFEARCGKTSKNQDDDNRMSSPSHPF
jgi:adenylyltransferase/sulfurtransferase